MADVKLGVSFIFLLTSTKDLYPLNKVKAVKVRFLSLQFQTRRPGVFYVSQTVSDVLSRATGIRLKFCVIAYF